METNEPDPRSDPTADFPGGPTDLIRYGRAFFGLTCAFWFTSSFRGMVPSCAGPYDERAAHAVASAFGPLVSMWFEGDLSFLSEDSAPTVLGLALLAIAVIAGSLRFPKVMSLRIFAYFFIFAWLFVGCAAGVNRIT